MQVHAEFKQQVHQESSSRDRNMSRRIKELEQSSESTKSEAFKR